MLIYRFRITCNDVEDFLREIEIQPTQTFLDFHDIIISCSDMDSCQNAIFFNTDKKYKPHAEISLKTQKKQVKKYDEELDEIITEINTLQLMKDSQMKKFIEDPHQKMIYEFIGKEFFVFNIELLKILKIDENYLLPRCIKKIGELPKRVEIPVVPEIVIPDIKNSLPPVIPPVVKENIFQGLHEDDAELAEIESHLGEFLDMEEPAETEGQGTSADLHEDDPYTLEDEEHIESLEDFEDIESLELKHRNFDRDSDEF